jgi:uncharacterized membrane protein HdeD (DUF308 family)
MTRRRVFNNLMHASKVSSRREPLTSVGAALIQSHAKTEATRKRGDRHDYNNHSAHRLERLVDFPTPGNCRGPPRSHAPHCARRHAADTRDILGFYWIVSGVLSFVQMFVERSVPWIWSLLIGINPVAAGILVVKHPLVAALTVPTVIVIVFGVEGIVMGVLELIGGFSGGGIGSFIRGAINLLIGLLLLSAPMAAALAVPFVFVVLPLVQGVALIALAFRVMNR